MKQCRSMLGLNRKAFSLVELSIVLVILGLLVGGILSGQSLIRAAEIRSVATEYGKFNTAVQAFRDKYFALPGDMSNATSFWGKDNANCPADTGTASTSGTCNGNASWAWDNGGGAGLTGEKFQFWRQLSLAGLIEGSYTGLANATSIVGFTIGVNCPKSKVTNAGWDSGYGDNSSAANGNIFARNYINYYVFGTSTTNMYTDAPALKPEEAWNIDTKLDDGKPAYGIIQAQSVPIGTCTNASSNINFTADYLLTSSSVACALLFKAY